MGHELEELIVRFAEENSSWGYDRIVGAPLNLGHKIINKVPGPGAVQVLAA